MTFHSSPDTNGQGGGEAGPGVSREDLEQVLEEAFEKALKQEREELLAAMGGQNQVYPRPLPAGPQAYLDPGIWRGHESDGYKKVLELMDRLAALRRDA